MAELFATASRAKAKGWPQFAVADSLTYRQISGNVRLGENSEPSLIIVQLPSVQTDQDHPTNQNNVLAKRFALQLAIYMLISQEHFSIVPCKEPNVGRVEKEIFDSYGMSLLDPEKTLFEPNFASDGPRQRQLHAVYQVCARKPSLPLEVTDMILDLVDEETPLQELTDAPTLLQNNMDVLEVHALIPLPDIDAATEALNTILREHEMTAVIYPWKGKVSATRREFSRLWDRIIHENRRPHYFAACFVGSPTAVQDNELIVTHWNYRNATFVRKIAIENVVPSWQKHFNSSYMKQGIYDFPREALKNVEILFHPDQHFYDDTPPWDDSASPGAATVFLLTKKPDKTTLDAFKDRMNHDLGEYSSIEDYNGHPYNYVDWEREEDGDEWDMLRIAIECENDQGGRNKCSYPLFVDQQSLGDGTIILLR